ncbi:MAG: ParB/RepB/Spo0J family partition protein [Ignavibacteria bacterium]|nr:ParB/RepB/Spo0J family partition protein [Ignavibacteria bacterium]
MAERKKTFGLGKGLSSLIPESFNKEFRDKDNNKFDVSRIFDEIEISRIKFNPHQPRKQVDEKSLDELAESIKSNGVVQPITVRRLENGYQVVAGERRVRAAIRAGMQKIPAFIINVDEDIKLLEMAIVENVQREDLNPIDLANGFKKLNEEFKLTQDEIAKRVGKERSTVTNVMRLLKLPIQVQDSLRNNEITVGHAKVLLSLNDDEKIRAVWKKILEQNLSVRQTEQIVSALLAEKVEVSSSKSVKEVDPNIAAVSTELSKILGTKVKIEIGKKSGKIVLTFNSNEDLQRLIDILYSLQLS